MKKTTMKELEKRIEKLEKKQTKKSDDFTEHRVFWFLFYVLTSPIVAVGYVLAGIVYAVIKPFKYLMLTKEEAKFYRLGDDFNECEYMWSSISPRYGIVKK